MQGSVCDNVIESFNKDFIQNFYYKLEIAG